MRFNFFNLDNFTFFFFIYFIMTQSIGSRRQVYNGTAIKTSGGLTKSDLIMSNGRIVSKSKHLSAKKEMRLVKHGYGSQKGKFGYVKIGTKKHHKGHKGHKGHKKMRGGHVDMGSQLSPAPVNPNGIDGQGVTNYPTLGSTGVQIAAGMSGGSSHKMHGASGGTGMRYMGQPGNANWNGDGIDGAGITVGDAGSANLQLLAGMAGGRRRTRGRGKSMHGGTTKPMPNINPAFVENRALMAM
jgi:hypothetical protein